MRKDDIDRKLDEIRSRTTPYYVSVSGIDVLVLPGVYPTSEVSELLVECMDDVAIDLTSGCRVLDYGTGTGFLAVQAAMRGMQVVALDINPKAIDCARANAERFGLEDLIDCRCSDCFGSVGDMERFDVILAGLPWDDAETTDFLEMSMYDPGFRMRKSLFADGIPHLTSRGKLLLTYSRSAEVRAPMHWLASGWCIQVVRERMIKSEPHYALLADPRTQVTSHRH